MTEIQPPEGLRKIIGEMLTLAADRAASHSTVAKAVAAAWSTLHSEGTDAMSSAFAVWCRAEAFDSHPSELGEYLRRHYATPAGVADSLRRAAETVSSTGEEPVAAAPEAQGQEATP